MKKTKTPDPGILNISRQELHAWLDRVRHALLPADLTILEALLDAYLFIREALAATRVSLTRLRRLFGIAKTEKSRELFPEDRDAEPGDTNGSDDAGEDRRKKGRRRRKGKGHGRNGVKRYFGAQRIAVRHESLSPGCPCPDEDCDGKVYRLKKPRVILRIVGQPMLVGRIYEQERLRCNLCEVIFYASLPEGVAEAPKYDATAVAMIAILHFGNGLTFYRLEQHQASLGIPLPASDQSEILRKAYEKLLPVHQALIRCAAQCEILHNDDTGMKILALQAAIKESQGSAGSSSKGGKERTGIHTTGIVAVTGAYRIGLYFTGRKHAGENLADVLQHRDPNLAPPIHVSDGLDHNNPAGQRVQTGKCLTHGRRQFVDILTSFPEECRRVVDDLAEVYRVETIAKKTNLDPRERLLLHQEKSGPVMDRLRRWMTDQLLEGRVEPNSRLGKAICYMLKRWVPLTLFLREPGAPLDNNPAERLLKLAIRHRKNSLFYKTELGAAIGDLFMSLIETCALNKVDAFQYLTALLRNADRLQEFPESWMPWNYRAMVGEKAAMPAEGAGKPSVDPDRHPMPAPRPPLGAEGTAQVDTT